MYVVWFLLYGWFVQGYWRVGAYWCCRAVHFVEEGVFYAVDEGSHFWDRDCGGGAVVNVVPSLFPFCDCSAVVICLCLACSFCGYYASQTIGVLVV